MKKKRLTDHLARAGWTKLLRVMKLTAFLVLILVIDVSASLYSQNSKVSVKVVNGTLSEIFNKIEEQSEYRFFYQNEQIRDVERKSIDVSNKNTLELVSDLLGSTDLTYKLVDRNIIIFPSSEKNNIESAFQQQKSVAGKVTDSSGGSLPGVSVVLKGTTNGTITDSDGKYSISNISENGTLQFSFVGMKTKEFVVGGKVSINVTLEEETIGIEEVVAVGYGTMKKSDLTGSLSQVKSDAINSYPATNVLQALSGRATGVQVTQNTGAPGGGISVRIRGTNSIHGSNEPLYVVDGFPISSSNPTIVNNSDIESIEILKDASATAIYGSRGANGVVLITTKRGKLGKTQVDFETSYSTQTLRKNLDLMNAQEYALFYNEQAANDKLSPYFTQEQINKFANESYDWQDLVFTKAPMKTMAVNVNGGTEKTQFSISLSTFGQDGIVKGSDYNRYSIRTNVSHEISKKFKANLSSTMTRINTDARNSQGGNRGGSMISAAISAPPTLTPYNDDGTYRNLGTAYPFIASVMTNPINYINEQTNTIKANRILTNVSLEYNPIPELTFKFSGGVENADDRNDAYTTNAFVNSTGGASVSTSQFTSLLSENTVSYNKTFNKDHHLSAIAGFTYQDFVGTNLGGSGNGYISNSSETYDLGAATNPGIPTSYYSKAVLLSYLSRVNYSYKDKYLATISFRADGSSKFSDGNKWGYFPSGAFAWRISNEDFLKDNPIISNLKLRLGWGFTGSQAINAYATLNQLSSGKTVFDDALYTTYAPGTRLPGNLKWETTEQKNIGIDFGVFDNRINLTADYYIKNTSDLLNTVALPPSYGYTSTIQNIGEMENKGFEFGFDAKVLKGKFDWTLNANISFNRNKIVKLYNGDDILGGYVDVTAITDYRNILRQGQPVGRFWGYLENGYDDKGKIKYVDIDNDGSITIKDKTYIGDPNPKFVYSLNSDMSYKNFELTLFFQGTQGNDIFNTNAINNTVDYGSGLNMPKEVYLNHWTPTNTTAKYPLISRTTTVKVSDRFVEDGSFLRLKNIQLAYNLASKKTGISWCNNIQIYISGQNLLTLTKYSWWDPEVNSNGGASSTNQGFDQYSYPTSKSVTVGCRVQF